MTHDHDDGVDVDGGGRSRRSARRPARRLALLLGVASALLPVLVLGCVTQGPGSGSLHRWWSGLGPVVPHDNFPADCRLCHVGSTWNVLTADFKFDHEKQTGVPLRGAHATAQCLRCHNDRGPVSMFAARGCGGCHDDVHLGELGNDCKRCHEERTWDPEGQLEMHSRTRFPLTGSHMGVACHRCHPGAFVGRFYQADTKCLTCHYKDLLQTANPNHFGLNWTDNCDRCHVSTSWNHASLK